METGTVQNMTRDDYADNDPQISPDGKLVVYKRRMSGNNKLYAFPLSDPSHKTQLTFGPFDDTAPIFSSDGHRLFYSSDEDDDIPNLRSLDLRTGAIQQFTDVFGGTMAPAPLKTPRGDRLAFITYYKGEWKLHTKDSGDPIKEVDQEVQAAAEGLVDFQPDVPHEVVPENKRRKKIFEGLYLEGRPPINVGVTRAGTSSAAPRSRSPTCWATSTSPSRCCRCSSYRIYDGRYTNLASRLHYGISFYDQTYFYYPLLLRHRDQDASRGGDRDPAFTGGQVFAEYPLDTFRRLEFGVGVARSKSRTRTRRRSPASAPGRGDQGLPCYVNNGWQAPISLRLVQETTQLRRVRTARRQHLLGGRRVAPPIGGFLQRTTVDADLRKYLRLGGTTALLALRGHGFYSTGDNPDYFYFGGNMELRGFPYLASPATAGSTPTRSCGFR